MHTESQDTAIEPTRGSTQRLTSADPGARGTRDGLDRGSTLDGRESSAGGRLRA